MSYLFTPVSIGNLTLKNRLVMPPMATAKADEAGRVTQAVCDYYQERARYSKIGLIITEHSFVCLQGKAHPGQTSLAAGADLAGWRRLTETVQGEGVRIFAQLSHAGTAAISEVTGQTPVGPSAVFHPKQTKELPEEMTVAQIHAVARAFGEAARRARATAWIAYGPQSVENRTRFHREVLEAVRREAGEEYPVAVRLGGCDDQAGGSTLEDCVEACRILEENGADLVHLTGGMQGFVRPGHGEPGYFRDMSVAVKEKVNIPVLLTGGVTTLAQAEELLEQGCADLIGVGRAIFRNPHWADGTA